MYELLVMILALMFSVTSEPLNQSIKNDKVCLSKKTKGRRAKVKERGARRKEGGGRERSSIFGR